MLKARGLRSETDRLPFTTIDDCIALAYELAQRLNELGEQKYPLDVRRGVVKLVKKDGEEVKDVSDNRESRQIKAGSRTYFLDIESAKSDELKYLRITESRFHGEGKERERSSLIVFPEHAKEFAQAVSEMAAKLE